MQDEVALTITGDPPAAVVQGHVVISAQQNAAIDVGPALISVPLIDVMRFTV